MKATYLLPCSCGEKIPVEPRQAGQTVHCACGKSATVPTLLEMAQLERAEAAEDLVTAATSPLWGISQRLVVLGAVVLLLALVAAVVAVCIRPPPRLTPELIQREVDRWPAAKAVVEFWQLKREGLGRGIVAAEDRYNRDLAIDDIWWAVSVVLGLSGIGLLLAGVTRRRSAQRLKNQ